MSESVLNAVMILLKVQGSLLLRLIGNHMKFLWKIGGEAGFGIMTTGLFFSKIATQSGYRIFDYAEYPSLIRGGHNTYDVLVSDEEVWTSQIAIDMLVCLNKDTYALHKSRLKESSMVIYDPEMFEIA